MNTPQQHLSDDTLQICMAILDSDSRDRGTKAIVRRLLQEIDLLSLEARKANNRLVLIEGRLKDAKSPEYPNVFDVRQSLFLRAPIKWEEVDT